ncbi:MAG: Stk1 family PASTA domain-containing Ser/Thr kinase [Firmicutes bacterium]|nr:Stk1 family PASTA domain-containing Ser/Thr kinase [Bacillota bacterium]
MIGTLLANRYQILEKIGEGGMALVYKARCTLLHRIVAVKILRPQYASDEEFVERFRREAQSAASLSHPNVVNIYDVGEVGDIYYIVMEYIEGQSLKDLIRQEAPLPAPTALRIAGQICEALQHAHEHNIVHRDIKPHNILLTNDGRVKVTDFGIARAASSATLTQTGFVIGSVHYFSPEQAKGGQIGPQSDLYSLGVVMYEMLTGKVPFEGDSPISIALKQIQENPKPPVELNPSLPAGVQEIILKAMAKDLKVRYSRAGEMLADLRRFSRVGDDQTMAIPVGEFATQALPRAATRKQKAVREATMLQTRPKKRRMGWLWVALLVAVLVGGMGLFFQNLFVATPEVQVPQLVGKSIEEAQVLTRERQLRLNVERRIFHSTVPADYIVSQDPVDGKKVKIRRTIHVTVSKGPETFIVPDLVGKTVREAKVDINEAGLSLGLEQQEYSSDVEEGRIIRQDPEPGARLERGMTVDITVSKGPTPDQVIVPDFVGQPYSKVASQLASIGLAPGRIFEQAAGDFRPGIVIDQYPRPNTPVAAGSPVDFVISKGARDGGIVGPGNSDGQQGGAPGSGSGSAPGNASGESNGAGLQPNAPARESSKQLPASVQGRKGKPKRAEVKVVVPPGPERQRVQIVVTDEYPSRMVYDATHKPGDNILQNVEGYGDNIKVQVYIDGVLYKEESL